MTDLKIPLSPVDDDFIPVINNAVAERERAYELTAGLVERGVDNVYLVGCGGSLYATYPSLFLLQTEGSKLTGAHYTSNEFNYVHPKRLGKNSLVIVASHSGKTQETLDAIKTARDAGATVFGVTSKPDSPLSQRVDEAFNYNSEHTVWEAKQVLLASIVRGMIAATEGSENPAILEGYKALAEADKAAIEQFDTAGMEMAEALKDEPIIYTLGNGPSEGVARCLSMCYLQEMQWMHSGAFNSGEFLHGAFEITTDEVPFIVYLGDDQTRPIGERTLEFLKRYTEKLHVVDVRDYELVGVPASVRGELAPIVLGSLVSRTAKHFQSVRGHDLDLRRYMGKVQY